MRIVDASTALPYLGDDPAQVLVFQEGVDAARGHLSTFSAELGTARSTTNSVWQATEADVADARTAGILATGRAVTSSLEAGSRAVGAYLAILTQGRHTVDGLRAEWDHARAQEAALQARPLATIEDHLSATAEAGRLTDQLDDVQRRFKVMVEAIETASNDCSQALNAAAGASDPRGLFSTAAYDDPLGPEEDIPAAGADGGDRWWEGDNTLRHNAAQRAVALALQAQLAGPDGKLRGKLGAELPVPGGSKKIPGNPGHADLYYDDGETIWIWELKGSIHDNYRLDNQQELASSEAQRYVDVLNKNPNKTRNYAVGEPLDSHLTLDYTTLGNKRELVTVDNAPGLGGGLYYKTLNVPPTQPPPAAPQPPDPPDEPWDPFSLGNPLTRESPGERLEDLNNALNAPPDTLNDAFERSRDRINEGFNDELNPFDGKDDARISTALSDSAQDIADAARDSILGIAKAVNPFEDH